MSILVGGEETLVLTLPVGLEHPPEKVLPNSAMSALHKQQK